MENNIVIETSNLYKSYRLGSEYISVLKNINIRIYEGDFLSVMGPSGSGKSTLLNILGCLDTPTEGEYLLAGKSVNRLSQGELAEIRNRQIGFIFQNFNLLPKLDIWSNVELPLIYGNIAKKQRRTLVEEVLKRLGLWERRHHRPSEISGGQKQRTAIARALVKQPSVILADEPTGNLDSTTTSEIITLLKELNAEGNTIFVITHEEEVARQTARIFHLNDGELRES